MANAGVCSWYITSATFDGVFQINTRITLESISDGTANTFMIGERNSLDLRYPTLNTYRGWAWSSYESSQDNMCGTTVPINYMIPTTAPMPPSETLTDTRLGAFGSGHTAGANFVMCDGSVHFVTLTHTTDLPMLQNLARPNDGQEASLDS